MFLYLTLKPGPASPSLQVSSSSIILSFSLTTEHSRSTSSEKKTLFSHRSATAENFPTFLQPCIQAQSPIAVMLKSIIYTIENMGESGVPVRGVCVVCAEFDRWTCGFIRRTGFSTVINSLSN